MLAAFFLLVRLPFARSNQVAQTVIDIETPRAGAATVALKRRNQANVRKANLGLVALAAISKTTSVPFHSFLSSTKLS
jgi:hypothetical protein